MKNKSFFLYYNNVSSLYWFDNFTETDVQLISKILNCTEIHVHVGTIDIKKLEMRTI